jgi:hypothetical protein
LRGTFYFSESVKRKRIVHICIVGHQTKPRKTERLGCWNIDMARSHCEVHKGKDAATKCLAEVVEEAIAPVMKKPTLAESVSEHVCDSSVPDVVVTNTAAGYNTPNTAVTATTDGPAAGPATGPMEAETSAAAGDSSAAAAISPMAAAAATHGEESEN